MRDIMLIIHFTGLVMGLGTSFGFMFLGIASSKMEKEESLKFPLRSMALSRMGYIGLVLLIISGLTLMTPYWRMLPSSPLLIAKLTLVLVLATLVGIIGSLGRKASEGDAEAQFKKIEPLGKITLLIGLTIIILAVSIFH